MNYPKFEQKIRDKIVSPMQAQQALSGYGIVMSYDTFTNTATVLMAQPGSDQIGQYLTNVPCPSTRGLQQSAPIQGYPCSVTYIDNNVANPMITHFFNHDFIGIDYAKQYEAENDLPRFMMEM